MSAKKRRALETATWQQHDVEANQATVVSSANGAKILKNLDTLADQLDKNESNRSKTFMGNVAKAIGASEKGSSSQYATFETKNGAIVTIRLANHNASTIRFDNAGRDNAISIVITNKNNTGIERGGNAHIVEFYYNKGKLINADGKPLADIVRSIKQCALAINWNLCANILFGRRGLSVFIRNFAEPIEFFLCHLVISGRKRI